MTLCMNSYKLATSSPKHKIVASWHELALKFHHCLLILMSFQTWMYCLFFSMQLGIEWMPRLSRFKKDLHKLSLFVIHVRKKTKTLWFGAISEWVIFEWTVTWIKVIVFLKRLIPSHTVYDLLFYKHSIGRQIASQNKAHRSNCYL